MIQICGEPLLCETKRICPSGVQFGETPSLVSSV